MIIYETNLIIVLNRDQRLIIKLTFEIKKKRVIKMKYYEDFLKLEVFNFKDARDVVGNAENTKALLNAYVEKGLIKRIRRDLYYAVNLENRDAMANRYVIANKINQNAYLSHHSAFEIHGFAHQVSSTIYVESSNRFNDFYYEGIEYKYVGKGINEGIVKHSLNEKVKMTDLERTIIESLKRLDYCGGIHELDEILKICPILDQEKLLKYLKKYDLQYLYKKAGYFLERYCESLNITKEFLAALEKNVGETKKYISEEAKNGNGRLVKRWGLIVPSALEIDTEEGEEFV